MKANNGRDKTYTKDNVDKRIKEMEEKADKYLKEMDENDSKEDEPEIVNMKEKIETLKKRTEELKEIQKRMDEKELKEISLTDPESKLMKTRTGIDVCYNAQISVDDKHHLIVEYEVHNDPTDCASMVPMSEKSMKMLETDDLEALADKGYFSAENIKELHDKGIKAFIPEPKHGMPHKKTGVPAPEFHESRFRYNKEDDTYTCPQDHNGIRYILRRNPVRAKEIETSRNKKVEKIRKIIEERNKYLSEHPRAGVSTAVFLVNKKIEKLKISGFTNIEISGRTLTIRIDENALNEESYLDGCYVIRSNLPVDHIEMKTIHDRYKDLANVEWAFRTMKSDEIDLRPVNVRKKPRTRAHAIIAMLSYIIEKQLREKWKDINITVKEGINELSSINCISIEMGAVSYNQIPEPRELGSQLLNALSVTLPKAIPNSG